MADLRRFKAAIVVMLSLLAFTKMPARAQVLYGSIVGAVEDPTGALVPNVTITVKNEQTGSTREVVTDEQGRFSIPNLLPGRYEMTVRASGFRPAARTNVEVTINTVTREQFRLEVGTITESVSVQAAAVQLQTDKADVRSEITSTAVTNLPLPNYRNYQSLINLVPGGPPPTFRTQLSIPPRAL